MPDLEAILWRYLPKGVRIIWGRKQNHVHGWYCGSARKRTPIMRIPPLEGRFGGRAALSVGLHECAHWYLNPWLLKQPSHVYEYEAERWAINAMRSSGVHVPHSVLEEMKTYVRQECRDNARYGIPIQPHIAKWCGLYKDKRRKKRKNVKRAS